MNQSKISVIVPCYNQSQYLDECLQSVLEQSYTQWECIIVNDGSPDNTEEVALEWTKKDSRFQYISKQNGGLSSARNAGIAAANGDWILPLDCDDKIGTRYLEYAQKEFDKGYTIIYCDAEFFGTENSRWNLQDYNYLNLLLSNQIFCTAFFKKIDWKKANGYDSNLIFGREDWDFWISILSPESRVLKLKYLGFYYRRKTISMDVEINNDVEKMKTSENYILNKHKDKYLKITKDAILEQLENNKNAEELVFYKNKIYKNIFTRILFKIITLF